MKRILTIGITLIILEIIFCPIVMFVYAQKKWVNDCMLTYVKSWANKWYIYRINNWFYIDNLKLLSIESIWTSEWCIMKTPDIWFNINNTQYCYTAKLILFLHW